MVIKPKHVGFADRLKATPTKPGVYIMRDANGEVLYVGKAANLRNRVRSYFQTPYGKEAKVQRMVTKIADFEYMVTDTVTEALLLENTLIKRHKPFFNVRLKDDKTYPYIKINPNEDYPQLYFTRRVLADGAKYFGPFASASSVRKTMDLLKKLFPYRSCTKVITGTDERPCLEYYIHRCVAPCIGVVDREEYQEVIRQVIMFLEGDTEKVLRELTVRMHQASERLEFERAAVLRDQVKAIESVSEAQKVVLAKGEEMDVIALASDKGEVWVEMFNIRRGKLVGRDHFMVEGGVDDDESKLMEGFIQQFYDAASYVPPTVLLQHPIENAELMEDWLAMKRGGRVSLQVPQRGDKRKLMAMVAENANQGLNQRRIKWLSESDKVLQALTEIQEALSLPEIPNRIECYDISNTQGTNSVGSMVVFEEGRPKTAHYRRFQIKDVAGIDDYSSMQEMLRRRFKRLAELRQEYPEGLPQQTADESPIMTRQEHDALMLGVTNVKYRKRRYAKTGALAPEERTAGEPVSKQESWGLVPGLVLIDGGKGHLSAVQQVFLELGITDVPLASVAKQYEEVYLPHVPEPTLLPRNSQGLYLIQRVRDEAHRFAITYHRQRRSKAATRSVLDSVEGVGPKRRRMLLTKFGSVQGIKEASMNELLSVPGMSKGLAQRIKDGLGDGK
jgi:excinuclease ABC subunit C